MGPPKVATEAPTAKQGFSYISHLAPLLITDWIYQKSVRRPNVWYILVPKNLFRPPPIFLAITDIQEST